MIDQTEQAIREEVALMDEVGENGHDQPSHYVVHLPVFEGPLDLLLHLIEKRQMEITTISLVAVTDQYLNYIQQWQQPDSIPLSNMSAFISIAARLLYIKSQSLLPSVSKEEMTSEMESAAAMAEELRTHLLEYKLAKEIAGYLRVREESGLQTYGRSGLLAGIETQLAWMPPTLLGLQVDSLATAFQRLLEQQRNEEANSGILIPSARVRVSERIAEIVGLLHSHSSIRLSDMLENERSRIVIIVTFLAVLELWKRERIRVTQITLFDPILLERGERWSEDEQVSEEELEYGI
ncbi:MAG: segregation and condensation protein A [Ktedonobacteraceae bacterium]